MRPFRHADVRWLFGLTFLGQGRTARPFWQVDVKWLFGLALLAAVLVAGGLCSASRLTEQDPATGIFTAVIASFTKDDDEAAEEYGELQAEIAGNPEGEYTIGGVNLPLRGQELLELSYEEAVDLVVGRTADILYTDGPDAIEPYYTETPEEGSDEEPEEADLSMFSVLTQDTHNTLRRVLTFSLIAVPILAVPLVFFSCRFGRLGSLGVALAVGTAPFVVLWFVARQVTNNPDDDGMEGALSEALYPAAADLSSDFLRLFIFGVALLLAAMAGHIGFGVWRRFRPAPGLSEEQAGPVGGPKEEPKSAADELPSTRPDSVPQR